MIFFLNEQRFNESQFSSEGRKYLCNTLFKYVNINVFMHNKCIYA